MKKSLLTIVALIMLFGASSFAQRQVSDSLRHRPMMYERPRQDRHAPRPYYSYEHERRDGLQLEKRERLERPMRIENQLKMKDQLKMKPMHGMQTDSVKIDSKPKNRYGMKNYIEPWMVNKNYLE